MRYLFFCQTSFTQHNLSETSRIWALLTISDANTAGRAAIISRLKDGNSFLTVLPASAFTSLKSVVSIAASMVISWYKCGHVQNLCSSAQNLPVTSHLQVKCNEWLSWTALSYLIWLGHPFDFHFLTLSPCTISSIQTHQTRSCVQALHLQFSLNLEQFPPLVHLANYFPHFIQGL